jgi:hypothetical protein
LLLLQLHVRGTSPPLGPAPWLQHVLLPSCPQAQLLGPLIWAAPAAAIQPQAAAAGRGRCCCCRCGHRAAGYHTPHGSQGRAHSGSGGGGRWARGGTAAAQGRGGGSVAPLPAPLRHRPRSTGWCHRRRTRGRSAGRACTAGGREGGNEAAHKQPDIVSGLVLLHQKTLLWHIRTATIPDASNVPTKPCCQDFLTTLVTCQLRRACCSSRAQATRTLLGTHTLHQLQPVNLVYHDHYHMQGTRRPAHHKGGHRSAQEGEHHARSVTYGRSCNNGCSVKQEGETATTLQCWLHLLQAVYGQPR